jgi:hypothetical protein
MSNRKFCLLSGMALLATTILLGPQTASATTWRIMIKAFDSQGHDTNKCISVPLPANGMVKGGYELVTCDAYDARQLFALKGPYTPLPPDLTPVEQYEYLSLLQDYKDGEKSVVECMTVLTSTKDVWNVGTHVSRSPCVKSKDGLQNNTWKFNIRDFHAHVVGGDMVTQIAVPNGGACVTANSSLGTGLYLGQCSQPSSLTQWHFHRTNL